MLKWSADPSADGGVTVWHVAEPTSASFAPSEATFMVNYRVDDLKGLLAQLVAAGVTVVKGPEVHPNGSFAWVLDPDGSKLELWQP